MKKVIIASTNPVKINSTKLGFESMFPDQVFSFEGISVPSGVSGQPLSGEETLKGAFNRAHNARDSHQEADFYVGLEGGVEDIDGELHEFAWIVVESHQKKVGKGKTTTFIAPLEFRRLVLIEGKEIGDASDIVFGESNSKQTMGAIGLLTNGVIDRTEMYRHAVISALIPFVKSELY